MSIREMLAQRREALRLKAEGRIQQNKAELENLKKTRATLEEDRALTAKIAEERAALRKARTPQVIQRAVANAKQRIKANREGANTNPLYFKNQTSSGGSIFTQPTQYKGIPGLTGTSTEKSKKKVRKKTITYYE